MNEELNKQLQEKYSSILVGYGNGIHLEIGDGWYHIIDRVCAMIAAHERRTLYNIEWANKQNDALDKAKENNWVDWPKGKSTAYHVVPSIVPPTTFNTIKEKFGELRIYHDGGDEYTNGLISMAIALADVTCEDCGQLGASIIPGSWLKTLCSVHAVTRILKR